MIIRRKAEMLKNILSGRGTVGVFPAIVNANAIKKAISPRKPVNRK